MSEEVRTIQSWFENRNSLKNFAKRPLAMIERICERITGKLKAWAFLDILKYAGRFAIIVAVVLYFVEYGDRRKAKHYEAWQVVNSAHGQASSGGRIDALQDLAKDKVLLAGVNLSNAILPNIKLRGSRLMSANLTGVKLFNADLRDADLSNTMLLEAYLFYADLSGAMLMSAELSRASLEAANLSRANLSKTRLQDANLTRANLSGASLTETTLHRANLCGADLSKADLRSSFLGEIQNWQTIKGMRLANIYGVREAPEGFVEWAKKQGAVSIEDYFEWQKLIRDKARESGR